MAITDPPHPPHAHAHTHAHTHTCNAFGALRCAEDYAIAVGEDLTATSARIATLLATASDGWVQGTVCPLTASAATLRALYCPTTHTLKGVDSGTPA